MRTLLVTLILIAACDIPTTTPSDVGTSISDAVAAEIVTIEENYLKAVENDDKTSMCLTSGTLVALFLRYGPEELYTQWLPVRRQRCGF